VLRSSRPTGLFAVIRDEFHGAAIQITDKGDVAMSLCYGFLVNAKARDDATFLRSHARATARSIKPRPRPN